MNIQYGKMMFVDNVIEDERLHQNISANIMLSWEAHSFETCKMRFTFHGPLITEQKTCMDVLF